jgi:hypothetical protein
MKINGRRGEHYRRVEDAVAQISDPRHDGLMWFGREPIFGD